MSAEIRRAQPEDADAVSKTLTDWIDETAWMPNIHSIEENQGYGKWLIDVSDVTVAFMHNRFAGFLSKQGCDIQALYLTNGFRGFGIGKKLLCEAKEHAETLGLWTFQANTRAQAFYLRNGFVEDERTNGAGNDEKLPDVHFTWVRKTNE